MSIKISTVGVTPLHCSLLPSTTKLRRLCFYRHLSVHRGGSGAWSGDGAAPRGEGVCSGEGCLLLGRISSGGVCSRGSRGYLVLVQGGSGIPACTEGGRPWERRPLLWTVHILLECILVRGFHKLDEIGNNDNIGSRGYTT